MTDDALPGVEEAARTTCGADEAGAAEDGDVAGRGVAGAAGARAWAGADAAGRLPGEGGVAQALAERDQLGAEAAVELRRAAGVERRMEGGDAGAHAEEERRRCGRAASASRGCS